MTVRLGCGCIVTGHRCPAGLDLWQRVEELRGSRLVEALHKALALYNDHMRDGWELRTR